MIIDQESLLFKSGFEVTILTSLIFDYNTIESSDPGILTKIIPDDFYTPGHKEIYKAILYLNETDTPINEEFIHKHLVQKDKFNEQVMLNILTASPAANINAYIDTLKKHRMSRETLSLCNLSKNKLLEGIEPDTVLIDIENSLDALRKIGHGNNNIVTGANLLEEYEQKTIERVKTSFEPIESILPEGIDKGSLIVITGETETGKTHLTYSIIESASNNCLTGLISLEFGEEDWVTRIKGLMRSNISIKPENIYTEFDAYDINSLSTILYDWHNIGVKLVVIDSLSEIFNYNYSSETEKINYIAKVINMIAKKTGMIIILIAQGSKEDNNSNRPGVLNSVLVPHWAKIFWKISYNEQTRVRTLQWKKNKQSRDYPLQKLYFNSNGEITTGLNQSMKKNLKPLN
ncbi:MAG: hypothetical protein COB67_00130 [SAR324 cluster bacterium]|uniref:DNA helicase n=1 Tax=SAR324 cluster bacterium TaxID=2024889 RepID=A0A2A4TBA8_9DELT|nr:MAG: hypothetical protein COB67_00130 [SAR324 cluster bacterium]